MQETLETQFRSLGQEDPLKDGMATHSTDLALRIPWTVARQGPRSMEFSRQEYLWVAMLSSKGSS